MCLQHLLEFCWLSSVFSCSKFTVSMYVYSQMSRSWWILKLYLLKPNKRFLQSSKCSRPETRPCLISEVSRSVHGCVCTRKECQTAVFMPARPVRSSLGMCLMYVLPVFPGERGCTFCGGLGHRITDCPKLEAMQTKQVSNLGRKDYLAHSSMDF